MELTQEQKKRLKKNSEYWKERFKQVEATAHKQGTYTYAEIEKHYQKAQKELDGKIYAWYGRIASNNNVSMEEARRLLSKKELEEFKWDVNEYIKYGRENAINQEWMKELENASAKFHISKFESLKIQTRQTFEALFGNQLGTIDNMAKKIYTDGYYHTAFEIQKGFNLGWDIASINKDMLNTVISKPWGIDDKNFSERIWKTKNELIDEVHSELTHMCILGKSPNEAIKNIEKKMNVSKNNASRLVMTESAYFSSHSQKQAYNELGVKEFKILATLDDVTSDICQTLDGKVFDMKDYQAGVTAPPFHPWCRSTTVPYFKDNFGERAARGEDGKTYYVPSDMTYPEWKETFVDGDSKEELKSVESGAIIESKKEIIQDLMKLKNSGIADDEYGEYLSIINNHQNPSIIQLYSKHADEINSVKLTSSKGAAYSANLSSLIFNFDKSAKYPDMNKYDTLAHEYGHFFDAEISFDDIHFKEIEEVRKATGLDVVFKDVASSSDEFLEAIRKDKEHIRSLLTPDIKKEMLAHNASHGVQDAIDGLFPKSKFRWGHGERYYNRKYAEIEFMDKMARTSRKKDLQRVYKDLGFDVSNQSKVKIICRQYEAASEAWANIMSAEVCGGETLEYVKKYLPNSYKTMMEILKGVK